MTTTDPKAPATAADLAGVETRLTRAGLESALIAAEVAKSETLVGLLRGLPGRDGSDGRPGQDGVAGDRGERGPAGVAGDRGPQGPDGPIVRRSVRVERDGRGRIDKLTSRYTNGTVVTHDVLRDGAGRLVEIVDEPADA